MIFAQTNHAVWDGGGGDGRKGWANKLHIGLWQDIILAPIHTYGRQTRMYPRQGIRTI